MNATASKLNAQTSYEATTELPDTIFQVPDLSDIHIAHGFQIIEPFDQVPSIQPGDRCYYVDEQGHSREGTFINTWKWARRENYERKFGRSWQDAKHWEDEDTPFFSEQMQGDIIRVVVERSDGVIDTPLAEDVFHPMEVEITHEIMEVK